MSFTHRVIKNKSKVKNHVTPICATSVNAMLTLLLLAVSYCACPTQPDMRSSHCAVSAWHQPAGPKNKISLCNHVTLYGLASPRLSHSLIEYIKTSHSFKHGYSNGRWVVLYALVSPQWSHAWFRGRVRTILLPATKLYPCVNKLGGSM